MRSLALAVPALSLFAACGLPESMPPGGNVPPPAAVIKVRGPDTTQYQPASKATLSASSRDKLDVMCIISDAYGVKMADLSFSDGTDGCTTATGGVYSGVFTISPVPAEEQQFLQNNTLTELPLLASLQGPFQCPISGVGKGTPYGAQITVTCKGEGISGKFASTTLAVTLK